MEGIIAFATGSDDIDQKIESPEKKSPETESPETKGPETKPPEKEERMKVIKILAWLIAIIIALVIAVSIYVMMNIDSMVKRGVEDVGPRLTQTPVKLDKVDISLGDGRASFSDFSIGNPEGYTSETAFSFGNLTVQVAPETLNKRVIVIREVLISGTTITAEQQGVKVNLQEIKEAIDSYLPPSEKSGEDSAGQGKLFMLQKLKFEDATLNVVTEKYGEKRMILPGFEQANIGDPQDGVTIEQLAKIIFRAITVRARNQANKELRELMKDEAIEKAKEKGLNKLRDLLK